MPDRTVTWSGPFTDEELHEIFLLMQRIEGRRPHETFSIIVNDPESNKTIAETMELIEELNPRREGYERTIGFDRRKKRN